LAKFGFVR